MRDYTVITLLNNGSYYYIMDIYKANDLTSYVPCQLPIIHGFRLAFSSQTLLPVFLVVDQNQQPITWQHTHEPASIKGKYNIGGLYSPSFVIIGPISDQLWMDIYNRFSDYLKKYPYIIKHHASLWFIIHSIFFKPRTKAIGDHSERLYYKHWLLWLFQEKRVINWLLQSQFQFYH